MTALDFIIGWPLAKAIKDTEAEKISHFLIQEIFMHYGPPKDSLLDNDTSNLLANVVEYYLPKLYT